MSDRPRSERQSAGVLTSGTVYEDIAGTDGPRQRPLPQARPGGHRASVTVDASAPGRRPRPLTRVPQSGFEHSQAANHPHLCRGALEYEPRQHA